MIRFRILAQLGVYLIHCNHLHRTGSKAENALSAATQVTKVINVSMVELSTEQM